MESLNTAEYIASCYPCIAHKFARQFGQFLAEVLQGYYGLHSRLCEIRGEKYIELGNHVELEVSGRFSVKHVA